MKKKYKIIAATAAGTAAFGLYSMAMVGYRMGRGPFKKLFNGLINEVKAIEKKYDKDTRKKEIVFYGASNFRLWTEMENDLCEYKVQNHGFGGSTDKLLVQHAERILYPYDPAVVVFQTGSNDYVELPGSDEEKIETCMAFKKEMFNTFHERLPEAKFVVMSGLLLPGRKQYTQLTKQINVRLKELCEANKETMTFVDAEALTFDGSNYAEDLFIKDKIHLNHDGQLRWCEGYIRPALEKLIEENDLSGLKR